MSASTTASPDAGHRFGEVREFFCGECGYGVVIRRDPPECPMCRSTVWAERPGRAHWN
jgi:rubrerythrin